MLFTTSLIARPHGDAGVLHGRVYPGAGGVLRDSGDQGDVWAGEQIRGRAAELDAGSLRAYDMDGAGFGDYAASDSGV